jgi:steroid delta-isomerase-like uncharacterized protein
MAEKDNIELAKQQIAALNARDLDGYLSRIDESYVGHSETRPEPIRGVEGVRHYIQSLFISLPDLMIEAEQVIASGDTVVTRMRATGTHRGSYVGIAPTNKSIVIEACSVTEIKNGKTIHSRMYADNVKLLQQLGVLSLPRATAAG